MDTLYWNSDSPYCRIALLAIASLLDEHTTAKKLIHLSWSELKRITPNDLLGSAATVPCLHSAKGSIIDDSLRIIAHLLQNAFTPWFLSSDGCFYRIAEGQLSRVMYALYDGPRDNTLEKLRGQWLRALDSLNHSIAHSPIHASKSGSQSGNEESFSLGFAAAHTFISICLALQKEWAKDIPAELRRNLLTFEKTQTFQWMSEQVTNEGSRIPTHLPCGEIELGTLPDGAD